MEDFVDETLQLSNAQTLQGYLSSSSKDDDEGSSPELAKGLGPVALGSAVDDLRQVVDEHSSWLTKNLEIQVSLHSLGVNHHTFIVYYEHECQNPIDSVQH